MSAQAILPDNMVTADCAADIEAMSWGVTNAWSSSTIVSNFNTPLIGDLDGDGHPEILCFAISGESTLQNQGRINNQMLVFDGVTKQLEANITMESPISSYEAAGYGLVCGPVVQIVIQRGVSGVH